jgi:hypothetical protein
MEESGNSVEALLSEIANISVEISPKETYGKDEDSGGILWDFVLIFNRDFRVDSNNPKDLDQKVNIDYEKYLSAKKLKAYQDIDLVIISNGSLLKKINYINSLQTRIAELLSNYQYCSEDKRSKYFHLLNNRYINRSIPEQKRVDHLYESVLIHPFLIVQKETLEQMSKYLDEKKTMLDKIKIGFAEEAPKNNKSSLNLKWNKNKVDLLELITALVETKSILKDSTPITKEDLVRAFSEFLNIDLSDYAKDLTQAKKRKRNITPYLDSLNQGFKNFCSR